MRYYLLRQISLFFFPNLALEAHNFWLRLGQQWTLLLFVVYVERSMIIIIVAIVAIVCVTLIIIALVIVCIMYIVRVSNRYTSYTQC